MRFSTIIAVSVLLLSGAYAQDREYSCWGHWDWRHRPDCDRWHGNNWFFKIPTNMV
ncbi:uncharacterized protein ANIA_11381 [Aspergillus nidulans FGSC A4]|uniref:Uncharacterized protein n=1 Tax=Emericella nidulans (strain FGSC A4 / ATCC 38163 / CBS 112.46 / NRRL 194 / M139) TaxID=227321 RepID=C8VI46_EMENI|nr:hypothetical protein [Aspergillus nidulans FGSC A4]CBF83084.1 TPA: hypothetical protein ANIA_11381 [Aspergillus nidulans FGSC A4]